MDIKKGLGRSWKAWGQWNNIKELLDLFGWKEWLRDWALSWVLFFVGGSVVGMFAGAVTIGSAAGVLLYALIAGVLASAIAVSISFATALTRIHRPADEATQKVGGDIFYSPAATATKPNRPLPIALSVESLGAMLRCRP